MHLCRTWSRRRLYGTYFYRLQRCKSRPECPPIPPVSKSVEKNLLKVGCSPTILCRSNGYNLANYPVEDAPVHHAFTQNNVQFGDGTLNLKVNGYGGSGYIEGAEIATNDKFQYASVRTVQKSSSTPGIVEGNFFYGMYAFRWRCHMPYETHSW